MLRFASLLFVALVSVEPAPFFAQAIVPPGTIQLPVGKGSKSDAEVQDEFQRAKVLREQNKLKDAFPLFEDVLRQRPENGVIAEEFGGLEVRLAAQASGEEKQRHLERAQTLFDLAAKNGNNSPHVQVMQEAMRNALAAKPNSASETPAKTVLNDAEKHFNQGDMQGAIALYDKALELNPNYYEAALFEGDALFKMKQLEAAKRMYAKAVAIDPNRDTAYRFWGDVLISEQKFPEAEDKIIEGILCEPYTRATWAYLDGWARASGHTLGSPQIKTPAAPSTDNKGPGNITITIDPETDKNPAAAAWMTYQLVLAGSMISKDGKPIRHSLEIETTALRAVLQSAKEAKVVDKDPSLKTLAALDKDGMLESWVLLNHADEGISHDFRAYRDAHRELMHAYVAKYIVHGP